LEPPAFIKLTMKTPKKRNAPVSARKIHMCHEENPGWLRYIGDYTTQFFRGYNKPLLVDPY